MATDEENARYGKVVGARLAPEDLAFVDELAASTNRKRAKVLAEIVRDARRRSRRRRAPRPAVVATGSGA